MGLLAFIPGASLIVAILLLIKGNEYAWKNRAFKDVQEFQAVQRAWVIAGVALSLFTLAYYGAIIFAVLMLLCAV
jgi:ABC-type arginine/histidine transport system permease subunit